VIHSKKCGSRQRRAVSQRGVQLCPGGGGVGRSPLRGFSTAAPCASTAAACARRETSGKRALAAPAHVCRPHCDRAPRRFVAVHGRPPRRGVAVRRGVAAGRVPQAPLGAGAGAGRGRGGGGRCGRWRPLRAVAAAARAEPPRRPLPCVRSNVDARESLAGRPSHCGAGPARGRSPSVNPASRSVNAAQRSAAMLAAPRCGG
jgi:hypothetical protein